MRQYETSFDLCLRNGIVLKLVRDWSLWGMVRRWGLYETSRRRLGAWWGRSSDGSWSMLRRTLFLVLHGKKDSVINTLALLDILTSRTATTLHSCPVLFWPGFDHQCLRLPSFSLFIITKICTLTFITNAPKSKVVQSIPLWELLWAAHGELKAHNNSNNKANLKNASQSQSSIHLLCRVRPASIQIQVCQKSCNLQCQSNVLHSFGVKLNTLNFTVKLF